MSSFSSIVKPNINVLVIGDVMLDHYIHGDCSRISPEAPVQVVEVKKDSFTLGGAGNVVKNLRALNCKVSIASVVGADDNAQIIKQEFEANGVNLAGLTTDATRCTTVKSRVLVSNHQLIRLDREDTKPINDTVATKLSEVIGNELNQYDIVLVSDYDKGLLSKFFLNQIFTLCRNLGIKTVVDPKGTDYSKYKGANVIKPNKKEAIIASGINITGGDTLLQACVKIKELTGCDDIIVTMSEEGMAMFSENTLNVIPTKALDVFDVTGAGDTVLAALGLALASGSTLYDACYFANHAAAVVVSKVGSATATLEEIERKLTER